MKQEVQKEILSILDKTIDREIDSMGNHYTVAQIAKEILMTD